MGRRAATIAAIEELYRDGFPRFFRVARAMLGNEEQARDAVQEGFARAIQGRSGYRGKGTLEAWVWRTVVNVSADERHRKIDSAPADYPHATNGHEEDWPELRAAIAALPDRQRLVLFLRHYADLDYQTIAAALGIRRGTVAATLHAAHGALRRALMEVTR
jgi:RNA polymerase sigma factor (sigma-70 family)